MDLFSKKIKVPKIKEVKFDFTNGRDKINSDYGLDLSELNTGNVGDFHRCKIHAPANYKEIPQRNIKAQYAIDLANDLAGKITLGSQNRVLLSGAFVFCDFIKSFIIQNDWHIQSMSISTLGMSYENTDCLLSLLYDGWLDELNLIISDGFYRRDFHTTVKYMYDCLNIEGMTQIAVSGNHTKDCIMKIEGGGHISIEGSANLRTSACLEKIIITESEEVYNWNKEYMDKIISEYNTINKNISGNFDNKFKALRVKKLWNCVKE